MKKSEKIQAFEELKHDISNHKIELAEFLSICKSCDFTRSDMYSFANTVDKYNDKFRSLVNELIDDNDSLFDVEIKEIESKAVEYVRMVDDLCSYYDCPWEVEKWGILVELIFTYLTTQEICKLYYKYVSSVTSETDTPQQERPTAQEPQQSDTESQQERQTEKQLKDILPKELRSDEAVRIFQKGIDAGLIELTTQGLKWESTKQLLAYLSERMSNKFKLSDKLDKDGNTTSNWSTFETLFDVKDLKGAKQNWMRLNTRFTPTGHEKVDALFV